MRNWAKLDEGAIVGFIQSETWPVSDEPGILYCPASATMKVGQKLTLAQVAAANDQLVQQLAEERRERERLEDIRVAEQEPEPPPEPSA